MPDRLKNAALLQAVFDAAVDAIIVADQSGVIESANAAASNLFGYRNDELLGQNVSMLMPESESARHDGYINTHLATGRKRIIGTGREVFGKRKNGSTFPLHLSIGKAEVEGEIAFVAILHDLTIRAEAQEALAQAQRMEIIGQLTGGISHDFNNLLTIIVGNLELLEMRLDGNNHRDLIADALEAAEVGADVTSRLLTFARRAVLSPEPVDLNEAMSLEDPKVLIRALGPMYNLISTLDPDLWEVVADVTQLQTAGLNLVLNARDAMPKGGSIFIETRNELVDATKAPPDIDFKPGRYVAFSVRDTGHGMTAETRQKIFDPFFTTKPSGKGTGLGMSMVYGFVKQSGGHIEVESVHGQGTTITLYFPATSVPADKLDEDTNADPQQPLIGDGELIMVVEDDDKIRRLSCERIQDLGFRVIEASSGQQAYDLLQSTPGISLIFADIIMPGQMSGYDLAKRVKHDRPNMKILLTSGYAGEHLLKADQKLEFPLLHKPYRQSELSACLASFFPRH